VNTITSTLSQHFGRALERVALLANEWDIIRRAGAWWIKSVGLNRWIQGVLGWNL
jgi:hypothetical protein